MSVESVEPSKIWNEQEARWMTQDEFNSRNAEKAEALRQKRVADGVARQQAHNDKVAAAAEERRKVQARADAAKRIPKIELKLAKARLEVAALEAELQRERMAATPEDTSSLV